MLEPRNEATQRLSPDPTAAIPSVTLRSLVRQPNVFRKRVLRADSQAGPGDWVAVYVDSQESDEPATPQLLGYGIYNPRSEIAVRMMRFDSRLPDEPYWNAVLEKAVSLRRDFLQLNQSTNAYRVVHAEADGFPGLVIDRYDDVLSIEAYSLGMYQRSAEIATKLGGILGTKHWFVRTSPQILAQEGYDRPPLNSPDAPTRLTINEFGTRFRIRMDEPTHKTGFFCDQRDNRRQLAQYCAGKSVLDLCCYSGGFAIQAKRLGQADEVTGVDLDEHPLKAARENANLNQVRVKFVQADVFPYMRDMIRGGQQFDVVVLDPPKLIRARSEIEEGTQKHFDLNRLAIQLVRPGGLLLTCTCSGLMPAYEFTQLVTNAARYAVQNSDEPTTASLRGRELRIIAKTGAAADHPVGGNCLETEYLTAIWARVDDFS
jgi:23S rRNA (cytosine1962-C5)-methyltransferase